MALPCRAGVVPGACRGGALGSSRWFAVYGWGLCWLWAVPFGGFGPPGFGPSPMSIE